MTEENETGPSAPKVGFHKAPFGKLLLYDPRLRREEKVDVHVLSCILYLCDEDTVGASVQKSHIRGPRLAPKQHFRSLPSRHPTRNISRYRPPRITEVTFHRLRRTPSPLFRSTPPFCGMEKFEVMVELLPTTESLEEH